MQVDAGSKNSSGYVNATVVGSAHYGQLTDRQPDEWHTVWVGLRIQVSLVPVPITSNAYTAYSSGDMSKPVSFYQQVCLERSHVRRFHREERTARHRSRSVVRRSVQHPSEDALLLEVAGGRLVSRILGIALPLGLT